MLGGGGRRRKGTATIRRVGGSPARFLARGERGRRGGARGGIILLRGGRIRRRARRRQRRSSARFRVSGEEQGRKRGEQLSAGQVVEVVLLIHRGQRGTGRDAGDKAAWRQWRVRRRPGARLLQGRKKEMPISRKPPGCLKVLLHFCPAGF